ncbi:hypothetical protein ABID52_001737 [Fictibacillus halophilus]|uniref:Haem-binding uptake, Tiki superfamily, ChaN n=1 Tax=Fictibacillus halophilus TaxID=1610490 RepID=A0ABV2LHT5_9BACL|nr:hypothetical protein [Fictibacillus halophilus]
MTHDEELQRKYNYPLSLVKQLITEFNPDVICGEVHPLSWELYLNERDPGGILGETQNEYPRLIFPLCEEKGIEFVPVNWFEEDVFEEGPFDRYDSEVKRRLENELHRWNEKQLLLWNKANIPFNSFEYDAVTKEMYAWLHTINPDVQNIEWNARHFIMTARVKQSIRKHKGKRILCIHGADHNYWYYESLMREKDVQVIYPLR